MAIQFEEKNKVITIHTDHSSYQMQVDRFNHLLHLYYGRRSEGCMDYLLTYADRGFSGNIYESALDRTYSYDFLPQEFPVQGSGDHRSPLLVIRDGAGDYGCNLRYVSHEIIDGKYGLEGLPAVYSEEASDDAQTLRIHMKNERTGIAVTLLYGVLPHLDIITRSAIVKNEGGQEITVEKLQSACLDFVNGDFDVMTFYGRHAMERQMERRTLGHGATVISSRRGTSSHQYNPLLLFMDHWTTEDQGSCYAMQFVYSGGFLAEASVDQYEQTRVQMGLSEEKFSYRLMPGESITAPEVIMTYSGDGLSDLSNNLQSCIRSHIVRGPHRDAVRPVLLNSWEACYMDFTGEKILELADEARDLGIDMLVLDDGWFGKRNDDNRALGDWTPNEEKLGGKLGDLVEQVNARGVRFGIWMEPEMISEDSDLYRAHPDWALAIPGERPIMARNQLVLDLSRKEVCDYIYEAICDVIDQGNIEYLKWDYNRSIEDVSSRATNEQGKVIYDYMMGLYDVLERLVVRYPNLLIEGCSGGGGRFDAGMLYYTPQIWCSDNTDAIDRLRIHYGTSFGYPASTIGAHVSACPNHQTGRVTPLHTRGVVSMYGGFGYELDPSTLSEEEREEVRRQIREYREVAELIAHGRYYRLSNPARHACCGWSYVSQDQEQVMICAVMQEVRANMPVSYVKPRGLMKGAIYRDRASGKEYAADALMETGFPLPVQEKEYEAFVFLLDKC